MCNEIFITYNQGCIQFGTLYPPPGGGGRIILFLRPFRTRDEKGKLREEIDEIGRKRK